MCRFDLPSLNRPEDPNADTASKQFCFRPFTRGRTRRQRNGDRSGTHPTKSWAGTVIS